MTARGLDEKSFQAHLDLLQAFLADRAGIVGQLERVLNAQRKPESYFQDRSLLAGLLDECFFARGSGDVADPALRHELDEMHRDSGFRPRRVAELHNDLIDPVELMIRGFFCWQQARWPGRNGRIRYANTLFDCFMLRRLTLLSMRLWDAGSDESGKRLAGIQAILDALWRTGPDDQPVYVRDARWLIPLAQSPTTDELAAYFDVAESVADDLDPRDAIEALRAHVHMLGGHLTSQIRHYCLSENLSIDEPSVVLRTRTSNALDFALLVQALVPLLKAYDRACQSGSSDQRRALAGAILQGISADPEVFVNRVELLGPYSMIEHLFIAIEGGQVAYSRKGQRHIRLYAEYSALIARLAEPLLRDCPHFRPADHAFSPLGAIFGTPTNLVENMALKTVTRDVVTEFSLEEVFAEGDSDKLAWIDGWRSLPHVPAEIQERWKYPQQFAAALFERIERELRRRVEAGASDLARRSGRLHLVPADRPVSDATAEDVPDLPVRYIASSDAQLIGAGKAAEYDPAKLLRDRKEGYFLVSFETSGGWVAVRKDLLTEILGVGTDARLTMLPADAVAALRLMVLQLHGPAAES